MAYATIPAGTQLRLYGGLTSPYTRTLVVDIGGLGNYTTISAAIAYAQSQQSASPNQERWGIYVQPGVYVEDVTVTREIHLLGCGMMATSIQGATTVHADASVHRFGLYGTSATDYAARAVCDVNDNIAGFHDCYIFHGHASSKPAIAIRVEGTADNGLVEVRNSYLYAQASSNTSAALAVGVHLASGATVPTEVMNGHIKTSNRLNGAGHVAWNEGAAVATAYVHVEAPWIPARTDNSPISALKGGDPAQYGGGLIFSGDIMPSLIGTAPVLSEPAHWFGLALMRYAYNMSVVGFYEARESAAPLAVANRARIYASDDGTGATRLSVRFGSGLDKVLALEGPSGGYISGEYYGSDGAAAVTGTVSQSQTVSRMCRVRVEAPSAAFSSIAVEVTTAAAAGTLLRFAIYKDDGYGRPGLLALDCGTVASDVLGLREKAITVTLTQGDYWLAVVSVNASTVIRTFTGSDRRIPQPKTGTLSVAHVGYTQNHTAGAAFPSTGSINLPPVTSAPRIMLMAA